MSRLKFLRGAAVALAALGLAVPSPKLFAGEQPAVKQQAKSQIPDITLGAGGEFSGRVVDHSMAPRAGAEVVIKQGSQDVARVVTDQHGQFTARILKGGVYQVSAGNTDGIFRLWTEKSAPPSAKEQAILVQGENGARGQFGAFSLTTVVLAGGVITAGTLGTISLLRVNNLDKKFTASN